MKIKVMLVLLTALVVCSSCSEKKENRASSAVKVKTMTVQPQTLSGGFHYSGTIEELSGTTLSFAGIGTVKSIHVSEGQFISRGQLVGVLDATSAQNAYETALAAKEQALDAEQRMKMLHDAGSLPEIKWIEVQTKVRQALAAEQIARKGLADTRLYAPFSGFVAQKTAEAGTNVVMGMPVVKLVKIDRVYVKMGIPEEEIARIRKGDAVLISVGALSDRTFTGRITEKGVTADPVSRTYEVKAEIENSRHELLPGMICKATVGNTAEGNLKSATALTIPADIIQLDFDNRRFVWRVIDGKAEKAYIRLGEMTGGNVTITEGLKAGDRIIIEGQQKVSSGMSVEEVKSEK